VFGSATYEEEPASCHEHSLQESNAGDGPSQEPDLHTPSLTADLQSLAAAMPTYH